MILVDTSITSGRETPDSNPCFWRSACHPFVVGELACGNLHRRDKVLGLLSDLPMGEVVPVSDVRGLMERDRLFGRGIGWVDAHLLTSALTARLRSGRRTVGSTGLPRIWRWRHIGD